MPWWPRGRTWRWPPAVRGGWRQRGVRGRAGGAGTAGRGGAGRGAGGGGAAVRGGRVLALVSDATDDGAVRAAVAQAAEGLGGVDILVNAAAEPAKPGARLPLADIPSWRRRGAWRSPGTPSRPAGSGRRDPLLSQ